MHGGYTHTRCSELATAKIAVKTEPSRSVVAVQKQPTLSTSLFITVDL